MSTTALASRSESGEPRSRWDPPTSLMGLLGPARAWVEASSLLQHRVWRGDGVPDGRGLPVLLIPGFLAGDRSLLLLRRWLRARNYRTYGSRIRVNSDCALEASDRLERHLVELTDRTGRRAAIVGQSRGGTFAKLLAIRRPDRVCAIFALGSPNVDPLAVNPLVARSIELVAALGRAGIPGMFRDDCVRGACGAELREALARPFPPELPYVSVYSRSDEVVAWQACLDPAAEHVHVDSSHLGMAVNPKVYEILGDRLGEVAAQG